MGVNAQEYGYFFNSNNSDRTYNAESFESWIKPLMSNGVFGTGMQVSAQSTPDMSVSVAAGYANINGKIGAWPTANTMTIQTASGVYPRWDVIVLRRDNTNRKITLEVKTGTASLTPSAPAPTRDADIYELVLAQIYVTAGTTSITNANIVDKRTDTSLCGLVTCPVVNPDFTGLYAQFTQQFQDWFDHMKDQLDDDAAGHLQLEIDDIKADIGIVEDTDTATHTIAAGQYVIWKGSLYKASTAIPATTALSLSNLTAVSNGLGGEVATLNGNLSTITTATLTPSGVYSNVVNSVYAATVTRIGIVYMARISVALKAITGQSGWKEIFTIPNGYEATNISKNSITNQNHCVQIRVDGNKLYLNMIHNMALDELVSDIVIYTKA